MNSRHFFFKGKLGTVVEKLEISSVSYLQPSLLPSENCVLGWKIYSDRIYQEDTGFVNNGTREYNVKEL